MDLVCDLNARGRFACVIWDSGFVFFFFCEGGFFFFLLVWLGLGGFFFVFFGFLGLSIGGFVPAGHMLFGVISGASGLAFAFEFMWGGGSVEDFFFFQGLRLFFFGGLLFFFFFLIVGGFYLRLFFIACFRFLGAGTMSFIFGSVRVL